MSAKKGKLSLLVSERALRDIVAIEQYSIAEFGRKTATKYLGDIEAALARLQENVALLRAVEDLHPALRFYRVNKHLLVCDVHQNTILVLTVIHANRDIPNRLAEMQPGLTLEVELLHQRVAKRKKR